VADASKRHGKLNMGVNSIIETPRIVMEEAAEGSGVQLTMAPFTRHLMAQQASRPWSN
jgi:hypothetical protein